MAKWAEIVQSKYEIVHEESSARVADSADRRDFYRLTSSEIPGATALSADAPQGRHKLRVPQAHMTAMRLVGRLVGEVPQPHVPARQETEEERWRADALEQMLAGIYRRSRAPVQFQSAAWHASVLGSGVVKVWWDLKESWPYFRSVKPENLLVKFSAGDDTSWDYGIYASLRSVASVAKRYGLDPEDITPDTYDGPRGMVTVLDYWDDEMNVVVAGDKVLEGPRSNPYGFIPYVIFRNVGPNEYAWGLSDQEFYEGLAEYYNVLLSQHADVIKMFSNPAVLAKRTGLTAQEVLDLIRTGGVIATMKENAEVEIIQGSGAPPEFQSQELRLRELLSDATFGIPVGTSGMSGTALMEAGAAQEALLQIKQANWADAQVRLNEYLLRLVEKLGSGKMVFSGEKLRGVRSARFWMELDSNYQPPSEDEILQQALSDPSTVGLSDDEMLRLYMPREANYRRLIDRHYESRIVWNNRTAKADPQYQLMLLNRFSQGAMSLRTFLEEVGIEDVEREVQRIRQEAEEMPWLRPQMAAFMQDQAKGFAGTGKMDPGTGVFPGGETGPGGSVTDMMTQALNGSEGTSRSARAVGGMPYGGA